MSTGREKDQKDFDLEQIVELLDTALESDDQRIKDSLRALLTITVLCTAERPQEAVMGPFARMLDDMRNLNRRLGQLEDDVNKVKWDNQRRQVEPFMPTVPNPGGPYGPVSPTGPGVWTGTNPNGPKPMWGPSYTSGDDPSYKGASSVSMTMYGMNKPNEYKPYTDEISDYINNVASWSEKLERADKVATFYEDNGVLPQTKQDLN